MTRPGRPLNSEAGSDELLITLEEADRLATSLAEHQKHELLEARAQLEESLRLNARIPTIRADAAAGRIGAEQADAQIGVIRASLAAAQERSEDADRLSAEWVRRIAEAGRAAVDATLAQARVPLVQTEKARQEAEELLERRRSEYQLALAHYRQVERDGDALLRRYDHGHAKQRGEQDRRKEEQIRWALRQPRMAIEQLPLDWQQEAYERYDKLERDAAAHRRRVQSGRDAALVNPHDASQSEIRL